MAITQDLAAKHTFCDAFDFSGATPETSVPDPVPADDPTPTSPPASSGASIQIGTGPDTLVLKITQDAYQGDAQYAVYVDGQQIGGTLTATALHGSSQFDTVEIKGDWAGGTHEVAAQLLNDLYDGTPETDRNLYVESATYNGADVADSYRYVNSTSAKTFTITDAPPAPDVPSPVVEQPTDPTPSVPQSADLTRSTDQIRTSRDGQVIENLDLYVESGDAIRVDHDNVIIRNVRIHHKDGDGIHIVDADNVTIENVEVINSDPPTGQDPETSPNIRNIVAEEASGLKIDHVTVRDGSTGIYLLSSPGTQISNVEGYNFHGPMPRGQFVQFDKSGDSTLTNFYAFHDKDNSYPEEVINVFASPNVRIANGVIDGNNAPAGTGIQFEYGSTGGRVTNVDAIHMVNGAFSSYDSDVVYDDTRTFDSINADQGRGAPLSNGIHWNIAAGDVHILNSTYTNPANPGNIAWDPRIAADLDIREDPGATPMAHITNTFDWMV